MKRELLELKQKLMQRFLDGAIDQETYNKLLSEIEAMAEEEKTTSASSAQAPGPVVLDVGQGFSTENAGLSGGVSGVSGNAAVSSMLPPFVTVLPPGAPMQMSAMYPYPAAGVYPGGGGAYPGGNPYPGGAYSGIGSYPGSPYPPASGADPSGMSATSHPSMMTASQLEVRTSSGVKPASAWHDAAQDSEREPNPEIDPLVVKALQPGETLEVWWHYRLTAECVAAWKKIAVPLRLSLTMNEAIDDESMQLLGQITNLHEINLTSTRVTDEGIRALSRLTNLESLILTSTEVTGATLRNLEECRNLRELTLTSTPFSNEGMEILSTFQMLDSLKLDDTDITDDGMSALAGLHQLQLLNLQGTLISDAGLKHIAHLTSLVELYLGGTIPYEGEDYESPITDKGVESLRDLSALKVLHLNDTQVTNACLASMKKMTELCELNVTDTYFSDDALKHLRRFENLHEIVVDGTLITEAGIKKVFGRENLDLFHGAKSGSWNKLGRFFISPWSRKN